MGFALVLLCFFLSGFAALLYETAWTREFAGVFGTSELAVVSVLAAYMGGLAAGAAVAGRFVGRVRRPVLAYGLLELGIALGALAVPWSLKAATRLQVLLVGGLPAPPDEARVAGALFYVACAFAILALPTTLMGATLPLLARHAVRREEEIGSRIGALYATNTAGAVLGAMLTGYVLLPELGLRHTVYAGAATNALVFAAAAALARGAPPAAALAGPAARARFHWVLPLIAISGVASFSYEVLWTRLLGLVVGGSVQGFATMLASFLLGIALGSGVASRLARDRAAAERGFAAAQIGAAALSLAAFAALDRLPDLARSLAAGRGGPVAANAAIALLGLLPGAVCIGALFPFAVRLVARGEADAAPAAARVYAWNTLGAIAGALAAGFLLLPALHFHGTMALAAGLNLLLALAAAGLSRPVPKLALALAVAGAAWLAIAPPAPPWQVLRYRTDQGTWEGDVVHLGIGRSATVMLLEEPEGGWRLTSNGLPESRLDGPGPWPDRYPTARWLGLLPVLLRPETRTLLVVGLGGGHTVEAVPSAVESIPVIELEREVVRAHARLEPRRGASPLSDPRVELILNDARGALLLTDARYDAIVSQPSHPWTAGASHLYTREFFSLARQHLAPGGVFVQWIGLDYVDRPLLQSLVATLLEVFPEVSLFQPVGMAVLFAASDAPLEPLASAARALAERPGDFARFGIARPEDLAAAWTLDTAGARRFAAGAPPNTDDRNQLAVRSSRLGERSLRALGGLQLPEEDDPLASRDGALDGVYLVRRLLDERAAGRALRLASAVGDPVERQTALGWARSRRSLARAAGHFRRALAWDPGAASARFGLLRLRRSHLEASAAEPELARGLDGAAAAVVAGWRHAARGEWPALRALESELASALPYDPARPDAERLRVRWRLAAGSAAEWAEAVEMAGALLRSPGEAEDWLVAAAAFAAERPAESLEALARLSRMRPGPATARDALEVLRRLPADLDPEREAVVRRRLAGRRR